MESVTTVEMPKHQVKLFHTSDSISKRSFMIWFDSRRPWSDPPPVRNGGLLIEAGIRFNGPCTGK